MENILWTGFTKNKDAIEFYMAAEKKTTAIKRYALILTLCSYEPLLIISATYNIIVKVIWEKCQIDPASWYTIM